MVLIFLNIKNNFKKYKYFSNILLNKKYSKNTLLHPHLFGYSS